MEFNLKDIKGLNINADQIIDVDIEKLTKFIYEHVQKRLYGENGVPWEIALQIDSTASKDFKPLDQYRDYAKALADIIPSLLIIK